MRGGGAQSYSCSTRITALTCTSEFGITRIRRCVYGHPRKSSSQIRRNHIPPPTLFPTPTSRHQGGLTSGPCASSLPNERRSLLASFGGFLSGANKCSAAGFGRLRSGPREGGERRASNLGCFRICVRVLTRRDFSVRKKRKKLGCGLDHHRLGCNEST